MFSLAPNILLSPNMTQNAERKHRTQDANTAHNRLREDMIQNIDISTTTEKTQKIRKYMREIQQACVNKWKINFNDCRSITK